MTGFAHKETQLAWAKLIVDVRSVNHRFLEISYHFPVGFSVFEESVKENIQKFIKRGKVNFSLNISPAPKEKVKARLDLAKSYILEIKKMAGILGIKPEVNLDTVLHLPGVMALELDESAKREAGLKLASLTKEALADLIKNKENEGRSIENDLLRIAKEIEANLKTINRQMRLVAGKKKKLIKDQQRLADVLNSIDINEELQRLSFHFQNFRKVILKNSKNEPQGKELDFVSQEMLREANTIGAKSANKQISFAVVEIKTGVEKMREQLQNVE
jgi:uncharacterized protein (TIGR00255 family)